MCVEGVSAGEGDGTNTKEGELTPVPSHQHSGRAALWGGVCQQGLAAYLVQVLGPVFLVPHREAGSGGAHHTEQ